MNDSKILYLVRHANSGWQDSSQTDYDRVLSERGRREADEMGKRLRDKNIRPESIICSSAWRAVQTFETLSPYVNVPKEEVLFKKSMYEAATSTLLEIVQNLENTCSSAMLIGHNPSMSWLAGQLTGEHITNMPTCSIATIRLPTANWNDVPVVECELADLDYP